MGLLTPDKQLHLFIPLRVRRLRYDFRRCRTVTRTALELTSPYDIRKSERRRRSLKVCGAFYGDVNYMWDTPQQFFHFLSDQETPHMGDEESTEFLQVADAKIKRQVNALQCVEVKRFRVKLPQFFLIYRFGFKFVLEREGVKVDRVDRADKTYLPSQLLVLTSSWQKVLRPAV